MKLLKYMPIALAAFVATGCSQAGPDPDNIDPGSFFPSYGEKAYAKCAPNEDEGIYDNTFNVQVCRTSTKVGEQIGLAYSVKEYDAATDSYVEASKDLFTVPSVYTYDTNMPMGYIPVVAHNELMEMYNPYLLTIQILDDTRYGDSSIEVEYKRVYPWESFSPAGTCNMVDGWIMSIFGLDGFDYSFDCEFEVNDADPLLFRLVRPYQSSMYFSALRSYNIAPAGGEYYITVNLEDPDVPCILPSISGFEFAPDMGDLGMIAICNNEGYLYEQGYTTEEIAEGMEPEERSTYKDGVISVNSCLFYVMENQGPYNNGGLGQITFPPATDLSIKEAAKANSKSVARAPRRQVDRQKAERFFAKQLHVNF